MLSGITLQSLGLYMFVATYYVSDPFFIIIISIVARLINGSVLLSFQFRQHHYL